MKKILLLFILLLIPACTTSSNVSTLYQEDFDGNCMIEGTTWSEMTLCLKNDRDKEWEQNHIANNLLNK